MATHRIFAAVYDRMNAPVERHVLGRRRERLLGALTGQVLDVGAGVGANLPYLTHATRVVAVEPGPAMRAKLERKLAQATVPLEVCAASAESLPFPAATFDAVVFTLALCTIPDQGAALAEARRVLKPGGRLAVLEHIRGDAGLAAWQDRSRRSGRASVAAANPTATPARPSSGPGSRSRRSNSSPSCPAGCSPARCCKEPPQPRRATPKLGSPLDPDRRATRHWPRGGESTDGTETSRLGRHIRRRPTQNNCRLMLPEDRLHRIFIEPAA